MDRLISEQSVIETIEFFQMNPQHFDFVNLIDDIKEIPSAEPKTGHWILQPSNKEQGERDFIWWKCSECGQVIFLETEKDRREFHAFCSRCGAKMQ